MIHSSFHRCCLVIIASVAGFLAGCGNGQKPAVSVQGQLFYKGSHPAAGAMVIFHPLPAESSSTAIKPTGEVRDDGSFSLTTYKADDGAPEGEYAVTIIWLEKKAGPKLGEDRGLAKDRLEGRYSSPSTTKLRANVSSSSSAIRLDVD